MDYIIIRPNLQRGKIIRFLLCTMLIIQLVLTAKSFYLSQKIFNNYSEENVRLYQEDSLMIVGSFVAFLIYILCIIFYVKWFRRAYFNLEKINSNLLYSNGWASGAWFIPGFHWIGPIRMMNELYSKTNKFLHLYNKNKSLNWSYFWIIIWWSFYIIAGLASLYNLFYLEEELRDSKEQIWILDYHLIINIVNLFLTFLAIVVVWNYNTLEKRLITISIIKIKKTIKSNENIIDDISYGS